VSTYWDTIGSIGTMVAVLVAAWQIRRNTRQATTNFEDDISREYRELAREIPIDAHLGAKIEEKDFKDAFHRLYQYIDLSNEQVFLRMNGRISRSTWDNWCDGIRTNLSRPAFSIAWEQIKKETDGNFKELRKLEEKQFRSDPRSWQPLLQRLKDWLRT